ncbi:MAG: hypothetical protein CMO47_14730 [Verrucomicrobiales bacterium]|nr:hypothetical protein [Verrucomicrobiales bacterium]
MASCEELFQRKLELDLQRQENDADLTNINQIMASRIPSDDEFRKAQKIANDPEVQKAERRVAETDARTQAQDDAERIADEKKPRVEPQVNIGEGQPINYRQQLRDNPEEVVAQYGALTRGLRRAGSEAMPQDFAMKGYQNPKKRAGLLQVLTERGSVSQWQRTLSRAGDRFQGIVDDVVTVRYMHDTAKETYAAGALEVQDWVISNPGKKIPAEMELKLFNQFKVALMGQRHYDYIRGAWGRIGNALQGRGFEGTLIDFVDDDVVRAADEAQGMIENADQAPAMIEAGKLKPDEVVADSSFGRVMEALDKLQTRPAEAAEQLALEVRNIQVMGVEPKMFDAAKGVAYNRMKSFNLLTKDWQLFNERTNSLNFGSNFSMAFFGPNRQFYEDWMEFYAPVGTKLNDAAINAWQANWEGVGQAMLAVRDAGKEVFMDAFKDGKAFYAGNPDTYGLAQENLEQLLAEIKDLKRGGAVGKGPIRRAASLINPDRHGRFFHAWSRIWLYEKTGQSYWLRPGLRTMGAVDNLAGFYNSVYKVRHDIEVKYRMNGTQLQMSDDFKALTPEEQRVAVNDAKMAEFKEAFYNEQPTETQRIAYRNETGIKAEFLDDQYIDDMIMENKVNEKYGALNLDSAYARDAKDFSEEMRFANRPGQPGSALREFYDGADMMRRHPLAEAIVPYFRAPFLGAGFDQDLLGLTPGVRGLFFRDNMTPKEKRRNLATLAMAGQTWGTFGILSSAGLVIGNGPVVIPGDRESAKRRQEWLLELKSKGQKPNSIAGVQLPGGFPIINTMFLMQDIMDNIQYANVSRHDQVSLVDATLGVLMGHLSRSSAIGQVQTLMEVAYGNPYQQDRFGTFTGYLASGRYLPSGPIRALERASGSTQQNLYRDESWTEEDFLKLDAEGQATLQTMERRMRNFAYNITGLAGVFGGQYRDKAWYGEKIRLPWGYDIKRYLENRFDPVIQGDNKIVGELRRLELLGRPEELVSRRLLDVPMTDDLQKLWNDTYGELIPPKDADPILTESIKVRVSVPLLDVQLKNGMKITEQADLWSIDLAPFLGQFTKGKTFIEAARALSESELYQKMEGVDVTAYGPDAPKGEKRRQPAYLMMRALKRYYAKLTTAELRNMENPPGFVQQWLEQATLMGTNLQEGYVQSAGAREALEEGEARVKALSNALSGSQ